MKRLFLSLVVVLAVFLSWQTKVLAVQSNLATNSQTEIEYKLPYPGVLPDSPWYFFKVIRDSGVLFLIRNQPEKAFYEIFLADKRMAAAESLLTKEKLPLAAVTAMKAEELLRRAVGYRFEQKNNSDLLSRLIVSQAKHREILTAILRKYSSRETAKAWDDNEFVHNRTMNVVVQKK